MKNSSPIKAAAMASALLLTSTSALAENSSSTATYDEAAAQEKREKREAAGVLGGFALGAVIGGPPGAILSAIAGGLLSNHASDQRDKEALRASLGESRQELLALREEREQLRRRYEVAMEELQTTRLRPASFAGEQAQLCCGDTGLALHFRTGSAEIEPHYRERLAELARMVKAMPEDAVIEITGYADRRGPSGDNLALSRRRTGAVKAGLEQLGLGGANLRIVAHGENQPVSGDASLESHFFDRRVDIKVRLPDGDLLTQSAD